MPGKWSGLRGAVEKAPVDLDFQGKVNVSKTALAWDEKESRARKTAELARLFCERRDKKDQLEASIKELNVELEALSQMMIAAMEKEGTDMFRLDSGDSLSIKDEPYCSVAEKQTFIAWVKETNQEDLLTVHYQTLSGITKTMLKEGRSAPPGIKVFLKQSITRRRSRA